MKPTLYEALGLSRTAADADIKAALRRLVRRYYQKTRAGHADVEEALRFLNHASHILGNPARRTEYDAELAESIRADSALTTIGGPIREEPALRDTPELGDSISQLGFPRDRPPAPQELAPEWSAQLADIRRTPAGQLIALFGMMFVFLIAWLLGVPQGSALSVLGFGTSMIGGLLLASVIVFGIVHLLSRSLWEPAAAESALTLVEGMIPRWRKDRTVFLGTGAPVEDATWLFRLRMAELKRVKAERVSDPRPMMRFFARLFDYSIWALVIVAAFGILVSTSVIPPVVVQVALHPLLAPILVSATWIPVEALLLARTQTTPGRWLLCVYLQHGVSNPYAPEELRFTFGAAAARAADVWWRGCLAWLPIASLVAVSRAREHVCRAGETRWDSERDCLVTHGPVGRLSLITLAFGLAACALIFASKWREPVRAMGAGAAHSWNTGVSALDIGRPTTPPPTTGPLSRISRLDDVPTPPATATPAPAPAGESAATTNREPAPDAPTGGGSVQETIASAMPSVTIGRRIEPVTEAPAGVARMNEVPAPSAPSAGSSATATAPTASSSATAPAAKSAPSAAAPSTPSASSSSAAAPPSGPASFFSNLWRKPQPVEPEPPPVQQAKAAPPGPIELRERRVAEFVRQAQRQQTNGEYAALIKTCTRWADADWRNPRAYYCWGVGLQGTGQHKQAIVMFNKAGSLLPKNDPLKNQIGDAVLRSFRAQTGG